MMALKKNDKLIIIAAIAVIIIAGVLIAAYSPPEETTPEPSDSEKTLFNVDWNIRSGSLPCISGFSDKKAPYEDTVSIPRGNLKSVTFNLSWIDDKVFLRRIGRDTLTLEITTPDGKVYEDSAKSAVKTKDGNVEIIVTVNSMPSGG